MSLIWGIGVDGMESCFHFRDFHANFLIYPIKDCYAGMKCLINYQIHMQLYVDFSHIVKKVVLVFFSASFRGLLLSSSLQGGIKLHARYNLTLSSFIYSYSPDLMQILYLGMFIFFWVSAFYFSLSQHDQFRKTFEFKSEWSIHSLCTQSIIVRC